MKQLHYAVLGIALLMGPLAVPSRAQDPLAVAPSMYKVIFENDRVRVMEFVIKAGEKIGMHSHPDHFGYVVKGGKIKISKPDGSSSVADLKMGAVLWINAETHQGENVGKTGIKLIVTELKPAAKAP